MPTMSGRTTVNTTADSGNVLLGQQYELAPYDCLIQVAAIADRTNVALTLFSGPDVLQQPGGMTPFSGTGGTELTPKYPDDYHWKDEAAKGDRLSLSFKNNNVLTAIINWAVQITPL